MKLRITQALKKAVAAYQDGQLEEAAKYYRAILRSQPRHAEANHNLGMIAAELKRLDKALPFLEAALNAKPKVAKYWGSYIDVL